MTQIEQIINEIDDDYLIGISNKGIVKRAYKDLENCEVKVTDRSDDAISADTGEEKTVIKTPLSESTCSCPSRTICKHRIMAIIVIKKSLEDAFNDLTDNESNKKYNNENNIENIKKDSANIINNSSDVLEEKTISVMEMHLMKEIAEIDIAKIKKAFTAKQLKDFIETIDIPDAYNIKYGSSIIFKINKTGERVKLLSPIDKSTCTCGKDGICVHKAKAILKCMYDKKMITSDMLADSEELYAEYDINNIRQSAQIIINTIDNLMRTGLTRVSEDVTDTFERIAVMCHNVKLAKQENNSRAISAMYNQYLKKDLSFNIEKLLMRIMVIYDDMQFMLNNNDIRKIADRAGKMKNEYHYQGELHLMGVSCEYFNSKSGYAGEKVYFLDVINGEWYTYTSMMPLFYHDKDEKTQLGTIYGTYNSVYSKTWRRTYSDVKSPWGINSSLEELAEREIVLYDARSDSNNNLSQTNECKCKVEGTRRLDKELLKGYYYESFDKLLREHVITDSTKTGNELVFVKAYSFEKQEFNHKNQEYSIKLYDAAGRTVTVMIVQDMLTSDIIRELKLLKDDVIYVFFGKIYMRKGYIYMYPLDVMKESEFE